MQKSISFFTMCLIGIILLVPSGSSSSSLHTANTAFLDPFEIIDSTGVAI